MNFDEILEVQQIEEKFPKLKNSCDYKSPRDPSYNCIAWAAGDNRNWWEPLRYWLKGVPKEYTIQAFTEAFRKIGYEICDSEIHEDGYEKVAVFMLDGHPPKFHAARQVNSEKWASKLGRSFDIEHKLRDLEGSEYGKVQNILKRKIKNH